MNVLSIQSKGNIHDDDDISDHQLRVTINIKDVNETAPVFTDGSSATREVVENAPADTEVGSPIAATDKDGTAVLTYSLGGTDDAPNDYESFDIDSMTGQLSTKYPLDYEFQNVYHLTVTVTDNDPEDDADDAADAHYTTTIPVTINVTDRVPRFIEGDTATRSIAENTARGTNIGDPVSATQPDIGYSLTYSLSGTDDAPNDYEAFDIDPENGQLITKDALNYETQASYTVTVSVTDRNHPSDTITVTINVQDQSEGSIPYFREGDNATRSITENVPAGTPIGHPVEAIDLGEHTRYGLDGNDASSFRLDSSTGQLITQVGLDYESKSTYSVTVSISVGSATDVLNPGFLVYESVDTITVTVQINNINEAPMFAMDSALFRVPENAGANVSVGDPVIATDPDLTTTNTDANPDTDAADSLTYSLGGDDAASFNINSMTGQLTTKSGVTYDSAVKSTYNVTVSVTDGSALSDSIDVVITVAAKPTVVITPPTPIKTETGTFHVRITFSESVTGFAREGITLGGSVSAIVESVTGSGMDYTAQIKPANNVEGDVTIAVAADAATNTADVGNNVSATLTVLIDTSHPTITMRGISRTTTGQFSFFLIFSEPVTGFTADDISKTYGTVAVTGSGAEYVVTITPNASGDLFFHVPRDKAKDAAGNGNAVSGTEFSRVTLGSPTVTITAPTTTQTGPFDVTLTFSENVTGFEASDISLKQSGTMTDFSATATTPVSQLRAGEGVPMVRRTQRQLG